MSAFILCGYPRNLVNEVRKAVEACASMFPHWKYYLEPSDKSSEAFVSKKQAERIIKQADKLDGAHIFAVTGRGEPHWEGLIRPYFRLRQIPMTAIGQTANGNYEALANALREAIEEEDLWIEHVKPKNTGEPLILPRNFSAQREVATIWHLSEAFNSHRNLMAASSMIDRFRRQHRKSIGTGKTPWIDADSWVWDDSGPRHGTPIFPEDWKYSFRLPDGFHFDVSALKNNKTRFTDVRGIQHTFDGYVNVTSHGTVRGK
ncbi:MAG: hypothetical protein NVSMB6_22440 [Burkholderiaceae bacterium]